MAQEDREWLRTHTHEINTVAYGTVGRATYNEQEKKWTFLREFDARPDNEDAGVQNGATHCPLQLLNDDAEVVVEGTRVHANDAVGDVNATRLVRRLPTLAGAFPIDKENVRSSGNTDSSSSLTGQMIAIGSAVPIDTDGSPSHSPSVPILVSVTGEDASVLRVGLVSQKSIEYADSNGIVSKFTIPSIVGPEATKWPNTEPILQILFSSQAQGDHSDSFLAIRQASKTILFQPLLPRTSFTTVSYESLQPNRLLSIGIDATGNASHADVAFSPHTRTDLAVVDIEGNWSTWHIRGRRPLSARVLYAAHLTASGKIFSWTQKKRPDGVGLYFDGWHKVLWLSSDKFEIDRILVCNRQNVKLFDIQGTELLSIDARLDLKKKFSYIVDVKPGPTISMCFILTTTKLLLFDIAQTELRDVGSKKGPSLLCSWDHYHNFKDLSLRLSFLSSGHTGLVGIYSHQYCQIQIYLLKMSDAYENTSIVSTISTSLLIPRTGKSKFSSILLALMETRVRQQTLSHEPPQVVQIITQYEDLAVSSVLARWQFLDATGSHSGGSKLLLRVPPALSSKAKSEKWIDNTQSEEDEEDVAGFIVPDLPARSESELLQVGNMLVSDEPIKSIPFSKELPQVAEDLMNAQQASVPSTKPSISVAFEDLYQKFPDLQGSEDMLKGRTISEILTELPRIDEAEDDAVILYEEIEMLVQQSTGSLHISSVSTETVPSLVATYEELFNQYVSTLPQTVSNRARIQREWIVRDIALEMQLSSCVLRGRMTEEGHIPEADFVAKETRAAPDLQAIPSDAIVFSDPMQPTEYHSTHFSIPNIAQISASQPQPATSKPTVTLERPASTSSHLSDAISRLSTLTKFPRTSIATLSESAEDHLADLLAHLPGPSMANADPADYNWAAAELDVATTRAAQDPSLNPSDPKAKRKAERLAKARRRAEQIRREVEHDQGRRTIIPTVVSSQPQASNRFADVDIESQSVAGSDLGSLPFRGPSVSSPRSRLPALSAIQMSSPVQPSRDRWSQPHGMPEASSSQMQGKGGISLTQPERGTFGARTGTGLARDRSKDKDRDGRKRKKVKPLPGFG